MPHISSIGAAKFTTLDYVPNTADNAVSATAADLHALFVSDSGTIIGGAASAVETPQVAVVHVGDVREFPSFGTPANIVNVPVYGQATSSQVAGQSDAPSLEFSLNYVPTKHAALDALRRNGTRVCFRIRIADSDITTDADGIITANDTDTFDDFYFFGTVASLEVTPGLTDAMQASMSLTIEGDFLGPYALDGAGATTYALPA